MSSFLLAEQLVEIRRVGSQEEHLALDLQDLQDQLKVPLEMIVKQVLGAQQVPDDFIDGLLLQTRMQTGYKESARSVLQKVLRLAGSVR